MNAMLKLTLLAMTLAACTVNVQARYTETMDPKGSAKNLKSDCNLVDDKAKSNQSGVFQKAIDDLAATGGGQFIIDYSDREHTNGEGIRGVLVKMARNFLIENMDIRDNFTTYCGITLTPMQTKHTSKKWPVSHATDGTIRNCRIFNASPGYGLVQLHGAQSIHFEDIYAKGGVALRLETGAVKHQTGIYDITAKNVTCEDGRCAVLFGPHSAVNGVVQVDGAVSKGCAYGVTMGSGGVRRRNS